MELTEKNCMSFTNEYIVYYCIQNFAWTHQIIIDLIHVLSHVYWFYSYVIIVLGFETQFNISIGVAEQFKVLG